MRIIAIGDIHGCSRALDELLSAIDLQPTDLLITLGDYINRGPDSSGVLTRLIRLHATGQMIALRGNHEQLLLEARDNDSKMMGFIACGGDETLRSYSVLGDEGQLADIPDEHWQFIAEQCVDWHETDTHLFVHAGLEPDIAMPEQSELVLRWSDFAALRPHRSGKVILCGHSSQQSGHPANKGYAICIDTWVNGRTGWLTALDTTTGRLWQTNQRGGFRTGHISDCR